MRLSRTLLAPLRLVWEPAQLLITHLPGPIGYRLRYEYYRRRLRRCGRNVIFDVGVLIGSPELVSIGDDVHIDKYCVISTGTELTGKVRRKPNPDFRHGDGELVIGSHVHIAPQCLLMAYGGIAIGDRSGLSAGTKIYSLTNTPYDPADRSKIISIMSHSEAPSLLGPVVLMENVWLGLNVAVMPGVTIEENSFVVSNSLVMGRFGRNSYIEGQPAKRTKERFPGAGG